MHIDILSYTSGDEELLGSVSVDDHGSLVISRRLPQGVQQVVEDAYARWPTAEEFMRKLPTEFKGAYVRARVVK